MDKIDVLNQDITRQADEDESDYTFRLYEMNQALLSEKERINGAQFQYEENRADCLRNIENKLTHIHEFMSHHHDGFTKNSPQLTSTRLPNSEVLWRIAVKEIIQNLVNRNRGQLPTPRDIFTEIERRAGSGDEIFIDVDLDPIRPGYQKYSVSNKNGTLTDISQKTIENFISRVKQEIKTT